MFESAIKSNLLMIQYAHMMLDDIPDERMSEQPVPGVNHPAWILGHLAYSAGGIVALLGGQKPPKDEWTLYSPGSKLTTNRGDYPPKEQLIGLFAQGFALAREAAAVATVGQVQGENPNPMLKEALPTIEDAVTFLLTAHLGAHLGQLSAWRRMIGKAPLF
jgi:hypothetical protein